MLDLTAVKPAAGADPQRLAALTLHAMAAQDRQWVLTRLALHEREHLESLLAELGELGIPQDPALVQLAIGRSQAATATLPEEPTSSELARALAREPLPVVQACLRAHDDHAAQALLQQLSLQRVHTADLQVQALPESATALRHAIREELSQRVAQLRQPGSAER